MQNNFTTAMKSEEGYMPFDYVTDYDNYTYQNTSTTDGVFPVTDSNSSCLKEGFCVVLLVVNIVIFLLGVSGNGVVMWISGFKMRRSVNTTWYLSLAVSDFVFCACLPFIIAKEATSDWPFGAAMCKLTSFIMFLNMFSSIFLLVLISADRCVSVVFPVWSQNHRTVTAAAALVVLAWLASAALGAPSMAFRDIRSQDGRTVCHADDHNVRHAVVFSRFVCGFLVPFAVITACYAVILLKLPGNQKASKSSKPFKVMSALIATFFICWLPYHTFTLLELNHHDHSLEAVQTGLRAGSTLAFANSFLNPILYVFMGRDFKQRLRSCVFAKIESALGEEGRTNSLYTSRYNSVANGNASTRI